jgi:hypothetical protein
VHTKVLSEDLGVDGEDNIRMDLRGIGWESANRINLAHDRDQWRAPVDTVMNFRFP